MKRSWKVSEIFSNALGSIITNLITTINYIKEYINWFENINLNRIIYYKYKLNVLREVGRWAKFSPRLLAPLESILLYL
jgi:hypothetical protein